MARLCLRLITACFEISVPLSRKEFYFEPAPIISSLKHGHVYIQSFVQELIQFAKNDGRVFPLVLSRKNQQYILLKNHSNRTLPLGGNVLSINGKKSTTLYKRYSRLFPAENKASNYTMVQRPEIFGWLLLLEYGNTESWTVEIEDCGGVTKEYMVNSVAITDFLKSPQISTDAKPQNFVDYQDELNAAIMVIQRFRKDMISEGMSCDKSIVIPQSLTGIIPMKPQVLPVGS